MQEVGYMGLYTQYDFHKSLYLNEVRNQMPVVTMHNYHDHPTDTHQPGSTLTHASAFSDELSWLRTFGGTRFVDRPFMITEYGHVYWNKYRYEEGIMLGAYAALQDWDLLAAHQAQIRVSPEKMMTFHVALDPVARASQLVSQYLFLRRDVSPAERFINYSMNKSDMEKLKGYVMMTTDLSKLMLLSGFGISYTGEDPGFINPVSRKLDTTLLKSVTDQGFTFSGFSSTMRTRGWLTQDNRTNVSNKVYESDNKELFLDVSNKLFTVNTPRQEAVCFSTLSSAVKINSLEVESCNVPGMVSVISLVDSLEIARSNHMLLVFATHALSTGMTFQDADRKVLQSYGSLPPLMQTGQLRLRITSKLEGFVKLWALNIDGTRKDSLGVTLSGDKIVLNLDTKTLVNGNTPFFELSIDTTLPPNGLSDLKKRSDDLLLYPNPSEGNFKLRFFYDGSEETKMSLYNALGSKLYEIEDHSVQGINEWEINQSLSSGIYWIILSSKNMVRTGKVIVKCN
jgi:hypothetical protein